MSLLVAALRLPRRLCAVCWTVFWQAVCGFLGHPAWSNPDLIGGFGEPIACRRCLHCGYREATRLGRSSAAGGRHD